MNAVEFDELLAQLPPEAIAAAAAGISREYVERFLAATAESVAMTEAAHNAPGQTRHVTLEGIPGWVRLQMLDVFCRWTDGHADTCTHAPTWRRPEPVWACAWRPGLVVCSSCTYLLRVTGAASWTCDFCGRLVAGPDADDDISVTTVWFGPLAFQVGVCSDCVSPEAVVTP